LKAFRVDLKTFLGLVLPNQYCHIVVWEKWGWFLGDISSRAMPKPWWSLQYSTIVLYDKADVALSGAVIGSVHSYIKTHCMYHVIQEAGMPNHEQRKRRNKEKRKWLEQRKCHFSHPISLTWIQPNFLRRCLPGSVGESTYQIWSKLLKPILRYQ